MNSRPRGPNRGLLVEFLDWIGLLGFLYGPLDRRLSVRAAIRQALDRPIPHLPYWACFGGIAFFLFLLEAGSGFLLMLYYVPSEPGANASVRLISGEVPFGWLVRNIHHWAGNGMLLAIAIHILRVFLKGAYARPRDVNWVVGTGLLSLTLAFWLTGALLPWSASAYQSTVNWSGLLGRIPVAGHALLLVVRGGELVTGATLARFYAFHVAILPAVTVAFLAAHFAIIRKLGISEPL